MSKSRRRRRRVIVLLAVYRGWHTHPPSATTVPEAWSPSCPASQRRKQAGRPWNHRRATKHHPECASRQCTQVDSGEEKTVFFCPRETQPTVVTGRHRQDAEGFKSAHVGPQRPQWHSTSNMARSFSRSNSTPDCCTKKLGRWRCASWRSKDYRKAALVPAQPSCQ